MRAGRVPALVVDLRNKLEDSGLARMSWWSARTHSTPTKRTVHGVLRVLTAGIWGLAGEVALAVGFEPLALADPEWASTSEPRTGH